MNIVVSVVRVVTIDTVDIQTVSTVSAVTLDQTSLIADTLELFEPCTISLFVELVLEVWILKRSIEAVGGNEPNMARGDLGWCKC